MYGLSVELEPLRKSENDRKTTILVYNSSPHMLWVLCKLIGSTDRSTSLAEQLDFAVQTSLQIATHGRLLSEASKKPTYSLAGVSCIRVK